MNIQVAEKPREADFFKVCGECPHYGCCVQSRPPLTKKRMQIIDSYLTKKRINIENAFKQEEYTYPREKSDGHCVFFDSNAKKCRIHPVKPETCVAGPITFDLNKTTQKIEWFLKEGAICPLAGELYKKPDAYEKHMISAKRELRRLIRELDTEALRAVLKVEEPDTFKVGEDYAPRSALRRLKL
jgi:Fe-S-cluster containining protein